MYDIKIATDSEDGLWNQVLNTVNPEGHFYDWRWRGIIRDVFNHKPYYLILLENGSPKAICPLFHVRSFLFGSALISVPYLNGGGIISENTSQQSALISYIEKLQSSLNCKYTEFRYRHVEESLKELPLKDHKIAMKLKLADDPEKLFSSFPPKLRSQIRRPTKEGCIAKVFKGSDIQSQQISEFYQVFSQAMRDLGTPVYSKRLFQRTLKSFGEDAALGIVYYNSSPVSAGITLKVGQHIEIPWAASLRSKSKFAPNMLLYWEILKHACLSGADYFDFGRSSKDSGTFKFKKQWGSEPLPLFWYYLKNSGEIPDVSPKNKKFELLVSAWQKLPLPLANILGPSITKSIP